VGSWRHIFFVTDLEGVAGVDSWRQTRVPGPAHEQAKALLTAEVNSVVGAILRRARELDLPAPTISVWDGHGYGGLILDRLDASAIPYRYDDARGFAGLLRESASRTPRVDALGFIGQHAMEGTAGNLAHSYSSRRVRRFSLNGRSIGELGTRALFAWALAEIPTLFVSGDDITLREAQAIVPGALQAQVKQSLGLTSARHLAHEESCALLASVAGRIPEHDPGDASLRPSWVPEPPYEYRKQFKRKFGIVPRPTRTLRGDSLVAVLERV
jgi:D-aminopeptidase